MHETPTSRELASIDDLIFEINKQKVDLLNGDRADGYLIPWEKYLVVAEGVTVWDREQENYFIVGNVNESGEITILNQKIFDNRKWAVVKEQITIYFPSDDEDPAEYTIECGEAFEVVGEVVYYVGIESIVHFVVKIEGYNTFTLPSSKVLVAHGVHNLEKIRRLI